MTRISSRNNTAPLWGWVSEAAGGLTAAVRRARHRLSAFLLPGLDLERVSLAQIRVAGAQLRQAPTSTPAKAETAPASRVALTIGARQTLQLVLKGGTKLKNDL